MDDATRPHPETPAPIEPQRMAARPKLPVLGTMIAGVIIALVAGGLGYALRQPAPADTQRVGLGSSNPTPDPTSPEAPSVAKNEPEVVAGAQDLKIAWSTRSDVSGQVNFFPQKTYDGSYDLPVTYMRVGSIQEGEYAGYSLYLVNVQCEGPCGDGPSYRILWRPAYGTGVTEQAILLQRYSAQDPYQAPPNLTVLSDARIPELEYPATIRTPEGVALSLRRRDNRVFEVYGKRFLFRDQRAGDVFVDDPAARREYGVPQNGFYVVAPDGTFAVYEISIPFIGGDRGSVPDVTWADDGSKNTFDYQYTDVSGCGSFNLISIIPPSEIDRARDLVPIGRAGNGDTVYGFRDAQHKQMLAVYEYYMMGHTPETAESRESFAASKPIFIWIDPLGRYVKFQRSSYQPAVECGKPVIYLYPTETTDVSVKVEPKGGLSKSEPAYDGGWNVTARPDGRLTDLRDGTEWPYLFWEGRGGLYETPRQGWVVKREEVPAFVRSTLAAYGLNEQEIADFTEFWLPRMTAKPWYFVTFLGTQAMNRLAPLEISPKPKTVFRILMDYRPLDAPITVEAPPAPRKVPRDGFTVIEWGGVLGRE